MILNQFTQNKLVTILAYTLCSPFLVYTNAIKVDYIIFEERQKGRVILYFSRFQCEMEETRNGFSDIRHL
jgi:hypothetical protein